MALFAKANRDEWVRHACIHICGGTLRLYKALHKRGSELP